VKKISTSTETARVLAVSVILCTKHFIL